MYRKRSILSLLLVAAFILSACSGAPTKSPAAGKTIHWSYEGEEGPLHWGQLDPSFAACAEGQSQSPIDLTAAANEDLPNISFHYQPSAVRILNNGHTVQVNYDPGSYMEINGQRYDLTQFHFHAPSEHAINGKLLAAELHLVHKSVGGQLAVVGVLLREGKENAAYKPVWDNLPAQQSPQTDAGVKVNAANLLPVNQTTYRYSGSLTTPPCTEGVSWFVMTEPVDLSAGQIAAFEKIFEGNNRPLQPLNERKLIKDISP